MVEALPVYAQHDEAINQLLSAVGRELERIEEHLLSIQATIQPQNASEMFMRYWESFLSLPVAPQISNARRLTTINAAVRRRRAGPGAGWKSLLDAIMAEAQWSHEENSAADGQYAKYALRLYDIELDAGDYIYGIFFDMAKKISPAHLELNAEIDRFRGFRVGIERVGDEI